MSKELDLADERREYQRGKLHRSDLNPDPVMQFEQWLEQTRGTETLDPTAMIIATVDGDGQPWQRTVLLKGVSDKGFVFFTNLESRKARHLANNPKVSAHFLWQVLERQVSITGRVERLSKAEDFRYFTSRPKESQLAALASHQSQPITARKVLEEKFFELKRKFQQGEVPLPSFWGGFRIVPETIEFWQGGEHRLHDRFLYTRWPDGWQLERLSP